MPSIPPESCHHRVEKSLLETFFEVVIPFDTKEAAENFCLDAIEGGGFTKAKVREVAK